VVMLITILVLFHVKQRRFFVDLVSSLNKTRKPHTVFNSTTVVILLYARHVILLYDKTKKIIHI